MRFSRKLKHGFSNPAKAFRYIAGGKKGKKEVVSSFVRDYSQDDSMLNEVSSFLGTDLAIFYNELLEDPTYKEIEDSIINSWNDLRTFGFSEARLLYTVCRAINPEIVVETGVASGLSSAMFLLAMKNNNRGHLYSIDLPFEKRNFSEKEIKKRKKSFPQNKREGWLVPDSLKGRWTLELGDARELLPGLLDRIKECDIFLHDSNHSYEHMSWEFEAVWPHLGSVLLVDDIRLNDAFDDFVKKQECKHHKISERFGIMITKKS